MRTFALRLVYSTFLLAAAAQTGTANAQTYECALSEGNQKVVVGDFTYCDNDRAVYGENTGAAGIGVAGVGSTGVMGASGTTGGTGVHGAATATSGMNYGVIGRAYGDTGRGVVGQEFSTTGVNYGVIGQSYSESGRGVVGHGLATTGTNYGMIAASYSPQGYGLWAVNYGNQTNGYAALFTGKVHVNGALTKSSGSFKIDHPSDPVNRYLSHSFVESPDMMNVYNGNAVVGADGTATVELPAYFEKLNTEYRYQLTPVGGAAPDLHIAKKIEGNTFKIAGAKPGMEVSWQVTGVRNDAYAKMNRIKVEEMKAEADRGKYLNPQAFGKPAEQGIGYAKAPAEAGSDVVAANVH